MVDIPDELTRVKFSPVSGTGPFSFTYKYFDKPDLTVYVDDVDVGQAGFSVVGNVNAEGGFDGGDVTLVSSVTNQAVVIERNIPNTRTVDITAGAMNIDNLNNEFDKSTAQHQDAKRRTDRTVSISPGEVTPLAPLVFPSPTARANKIFSFDVNGDPDYSISSLDVSIVAAIAAEIVVVAGISGSITTLDAISADITTLAPQAANIAIVAGSIGNVTIVASDITNVNLVGDDLALGAGSLIFQAPTHAANTLNDATFSAAVQAEIAKRWLGSHVSEAALLAAFIPGTHLDGAFGINEANGLVGVVFNNGASVAYGSAGDALLSNLASTANAKGASLIGIEDSGALIAASTVEGALAELASGSAIGQFNVKHFGATGDGVTDDTTAVNAALAAVITAGGGDLFFPDGATYVLDGVVATALVNCRITGHGSTLQLPPLGTSRSVILTLTDALDVEIDGLIFDGQNATRTGTGIGDFGTLSARVDLPQDALIVLKNSKRIDVHHNTLQDVRIEAFRISDGAGACEDVDLHHNKFSECGFGVWADGEGSATDNATNSVRIHFRFNRYGGVLWNNVGVQYNLCDDMAGSIIEGNFFENSVRTSVALAMCRDVKIINNTCFRNVTHVTKQSCLHAETDCESIQIIGNYVNNPVDGYGIRYKQGNDTGLISGNIIGRCESYGIYLPTSVPNRKGLVPQWTLDEDVIDDDIRSLMVTNNQLINNDGIRLEKDSTGEMQRVIITGNTINKSGSHGIAFTGDTLSDFVDLVISNNLIVGPAIDSIFVEYCSRGSITGNVLISGLTGINLDNSTIMSVNGNTLRSHSVGGIVEANGSNNNNIHGNMLSNISTNPIVRLGSETRAGANVTGQTQIIVATTTLSIPHYLDDIINVTGTTQIEGINAADYWEGRRVTILFSNGVTIKDGIGNLRLAGDFIATGGDVLALIGFGGNFYEVSRADNA